MKVEVGRSVQSLFAMAIRGGGLVARFALALYLASFLGLQAVGQFGLVQGLAGAAPSLLGLGLNYYLGREVVDVSKERAGQVIRDRMVVSLSVLALGAALAIGALVFGAVAPPPDVGLILFIVAAETLGVDIQVTLISLRRPLAANLLFFIRSAAWVVPVIVLGLIWPSMRRLDVTFAIWAAGLALSLGVAPLLFRDWPLRRILAERFDLDWLMTRVTRGGVIYLNDIGVIGQVYLDRYVVNHFLGVQQVGVYTLNFTLANAISVLVNTGIIQTGLPQLVSAARHSLSFWLKVLTAQLWMASLVGLGLAACILFSALILLPALGLPQYAADPPLLWMMMTGSVIKCLSDTLHFGLYSRNMDHTLAFCNIFGLLVSFCFSVLLSPYLGLSGIGISWIATASLLLILRAAFLISNHKTEVTTNPGAPTLETFE